MKQVPRQTYATNKMAWEGENKSLTNTRILPSESKNKLHNIYDDR